MIPIIKRTAITGISHQRLLCQRKDNSSTTMSNFEKKLPIAPIFASNFKLFPDHEVSKDQNVDGAFIEGGVGVGRCCDDWLSFQIEGCV